MKKTKKVLLLTMLFVSIFCFIGKANAATKAWGIHNASLICDPQKLEPGKDATCYFFGTQEANADMDGDNTGFYLQMYTTEKLELLNVEVNPNVNNAGAKFALSSGTNIENPFGALTSDMPDGIAKFKCNVVSTKGTSMNSSGCGIFYTKKGFADAFNKGSMKIYGYLEKNLNLVTGYNISKDDAVVLGSITVHLPDDNNLEGCGDICIAAFGVADASDWGHADCNKPEGTSSWDGENCGNGGIINQTPTTTQVKDGAFNCYELSLKADPAQPIETGAFVSYAILAAAALIGISAVTISKKHNRLQKI